MRNLTTPALLAATLSVLATNLNAQIPAGWYITAHGRTSTQAGGLFLHHPSGAVPYITVTGLPADLTGYTPWSANGNNGGNAIAVMPDGSVAVGHVSGFGRWLNLHHLNLTVNIGAGTAVAAQVQPPIPLGTASNNSRAQLAEIEVVGPNEVVIAVGTLGAGALGGTGINAPLGSEYAGRVDLSTRTVTPITPLNGLAGAANSIASDGTDVWLGMGASNTLYRLPITGGIATTLASPGQINNLALDPNGNLVCTLGNRHETRNAQTGALLQTCNAAGGNALAIEEATGDWILINLRRVERMAGCSTPALITPPVSGNPSAIAIASNPTVYGAPSPTAGPNYRWQVAPTGTGLPLVGNTGFALTVQPQSGPITFGIWAASLSRQNPPVSISGLDVLVDPNTVIATNTVGAGGTVPFGIPANPSFRGLPVHVQSFHVTTSNGFAASNGVAFEVL